MKQRFLTIAAFGAAALLLTAASAQAAPRGGFHRGGGRTRVIITGGFYRPWWGWGWGYPGYYGYGPYGYGYGYGYGYRDGNWSSVKTDVEPEDARVYLDGKYIGTADDFDGWPDKLYLRPGHYRLEFRLSGYEPKVIEVDSRAGRELKVDDKLQRGGPRVGTQSDPPKLEGNVQRYFGKRRDRDRGRDGARTYPGRGTDSYVGSDDEDAPDADWDADHDGDRDRGQAEDAPRSAEPAPRAEAPRSDAWRSDRRPADASVSARPDSRRDRGRLKITVEPSDAVVYIDDRFVGSADEITSMDRGIVVAPGKHTVTVSRPGYRDKSLEVTVDAGKLETVEISLAR